MRRAAILAGLIVPIFLAGCYHYNFEGNMAPQPPAAGKEEIAYFSYDRTLDATISFHGKTEDHKSYTMREFKWKVADYPTVPNKVAKGYFFEPKDKSKKRPALVILPPTGGPYEIVEGFGEFFAERGYVVAAMRRRNAFFNPNENDEYNANLIRQAVVDGRRAIDYLEGLEYVDKDRICLMGISLGGIVGALVMETDARVKAAGFLVTAGYLPDILVTSGYSYVDRYRDALIERSGVKRSDLKEYVTPIFQQLDPTTYAAERLDPGRVLMVNGMMDDIIQPDVVLKTREAYGRPTLYFLFGGHYTNIGIDGYANRRIHEHFIRVLGIDPKTTN